MGSKRWAIIAALVGSGLMLFFNLWGRSLENHDYFRYAQVAKEMIFSGDWIIPRYNGEVFIQKPPLLSWLIAISAVTWGGLTPFLARLPGVLAAWGGGIVVYLWGRRIWGDKRCGWIACWVLISSHLYFDMGRIARTDMLFSFMILLSLYFFRLGYEEA